MNESISTSMKDLILNASARMTENCHSMDFIVSKGNRHLPDRGSIIGISERPAESDVSRIFWR